ncbi:transposase [Treponema sp. TIM-1]|uniref:transposase n=1 Tax=Treponema sp. TIM-1 TaxID=2898417 RepID=UPI00397FB790
MGKNDQEQRVYPREFKAEAVALAEKHEKPVSRIAADLGINENMLRRDYGKGGKSEESGPVTAGKRLKCPPEGEIHPHDHLEPWA